MKCRDGYTLVELLIVMAIMAILFTIGYLNFQDYSRQQELLSVVRSVQNDLSFTRQSAISGNKPATCVTLLNGYQFNVTSATSYTINANCTTNSILQVKQVTLPTGMTIVAPNPNPLFFKALADGTNIALGSTSTVVVRQTSTNNSRSIIIGANGDVK